MELFLRCPVCGSSDTYQHYDDDLAGCNGCGEVFDQDEAELLDFEDDEEKEDDEWP